MTTVGLFLEQQADADMFWEQCDEPYGRHRGLEFRCGNRTADHILLIGTPYFPGPREKLPTRERLKSAVKGDAARRKLIAAWEKFGVPREKTTVLFYEPTPNVKDVHYEVARLFAHKVYGTDERADEQVPLPTMWLVEGTVHELRALEPPEKTVPLAIVTSGKSYLPGHGERLDFLARLQAAGVPMEVFGRGLPPATGSRGSIRSKRAALLPARFALSIENHAGSPCYVTEKLWDGLLCWCLPLYYGPAAAAERVPADAFLRLPDLADGGVETVREALAKPGLWEERLEAIAEARRRILDELRTVEWIRREIVGQA